MNGRLFNFRAIYLLVLSSTLLFWVASFWLPLDRYLTAITDKDYEPYRGYIQLMVASYLVVIVLNLVISGLLVTKISQRVKFWLALIPGVYIFLLPFIMSIPVAMKFPKQSYFDVFQALYRLFRFTKPDTFALALTAMAVAAALNVFAAILVKRGDTEGKLNNELRNRYLSYTGAFAVVLSIFLGITLVNANMRSLDRASCSEYINRELPIVDEEITPFLNDITLYGQQAGTSELRSSMLEFATLSRQYNSMLTSGVDDATSAQYQVAVAAAKTKVTDICKEFATK